MSAYSGMRPPESATHVSERVAYSWLDCQGGERHDGPCPKDIRHLWVWHYCTHVLGPDTIAPGSEFGWRPSGVGLHTLVQVEPLTITASVYWPDCCGLHGFITNGQWVGA